MRPWRSTCVAVLAAGFFGLAVAWAQDEKSVASNSRSVLVATARLVEPLGSARKLTLYGTLGGEGTLVLDPNHCSINSFGDDEACTRMAVMTRGVRLPRLRIADPAHKGRALYLVAGAGLKGRLYFVAPPDPGVGPYRFVYQAGEISRVVTGERLVHAKTESLAGPGEIPIIDVAPHAGERCETIDYEDAIVVPGFVNDTYILIVCGEAPADGMAVRLSPVVYVMQPDYWQIDLIGCTGGGNKPCATRAFIAEISLDGIRGKKGIKVVGKTRQKSFDVPPRAGAE